MPGVELADIPYPFDAPPVAEMAAQREAGVGGVGDEPAGAQDLDDLADRPPLRIDRVHCEVPRHAGSLEPGIAHRSGLWTCVPARRG